ncbi:MAG: energy-coupling factor ABC transporter permease [Glaciecola sp.]
MHKPEALLQSSNYFWLPVGGLLLKAIIYLVTFLQISCLLIFISFVLLTCKRTNFRTIINSKKHQHIIFGFTTLVFVLWLFRVSIYDGLIIHFLGLTMLALVLGFRWSIISASFVLMCATLIGNESWAMLGVNGIFGVLLPIAITYGIFMLVFHRVERNLFVYLFLCAFFPGAITIAAKMLLFSGYFYVEGMYTWDVLSYNYTNMTWLMVFPEAFFNGFGMTCLIVYKPDLVYTFDDKFYIEGK